MKYICINSFVYKGFNYCKGERLIIENRGDIILIKDTFIRSGGNYWYSLPNNFKDNFITLEEYRNLKLEKIFEI